MMRFVHNFCYFFYEYEQRYKEFQTYDGAAPLNLPLIMLHKQVTVVNNRECLRDCHGWSAVTISSASGSRFKGFLLQAKEVTGQNAGQSVGTFYNPPRYSAMELACLGVCIGWHDKYACFFRTVSFCSRSRRNETVFALNYSGKTEYSGSVQRVLNNFDVITLDFG